MSKLIALLLALSLSSSCMALALGGIGAAGAGIGYSYYKSAKVEEKNAYEDYRAKEINAGRTPLTFDQWRYYR